MIGGFASGFTYTILYGRFNEGGHPQFVWYVLGGHMILAVLVFYLFVRFAGEFKEQES
jgi:phosphotransferase system  glucose/maltose/N-acetylglucosamine-specific IIC component